MKPPTKSAWIRSALRRGARSAVENLGPGAMIWAVGLIILGGYFLLPSVNQAFDAIAEFRERVGLVFALFSTALFGGVIPWLVMRARPKTRRAATWGYGLFITLFWGLKGIEIDLLYRLQAYVFGDSAELGVIVAKTLVDQLIYVPLWAVPSTVLLYQWKNSGFERGGLLGRVSGRWYIRKTLPTLLMNWVVWLPTVVMIYILPQALQLPMQNLVLCLWSLMLVFLTGRK